MHQVIEVKEFDTIICNPTFKDDSRYHYLEKDAFLELRQFFEEYADRAGADSVEQFIKPVYKRGIHEGMVLQNYVGMLELKKGLQIEILPKLPLDPKAEDTGETKRLFLRMLNTLFRFPAKTIQEASVGAGRMTFFDLFIDLFLRQISNLVIKGLKRSYIRSEENRTYLKGKLLTSEQIKRNLFHRERFFVSYDELHENIPENRILKTALLYLQKTARHGQHKKRIRQLLVSFDQVEASVNLEKDFASVHPDHSMQDYVPLLRWSKIILSGSGFTPFSGKHEAPALLLPMEKIYEAYVGHELKKYFHPLGWEVSLQDQGKHLLYDPEPFSYLRPDIVMTKRDTTLVLDTKWKQLTADRKNRYGISQADLYQMYAYSKKYGAKDVWLLYPAFSVLSKNEVRTFESRDRDLNTRIHLFFLDLTEIRLSFGQLEREIVLFSERS